MLYEVITGLVLISAWMVVVGARDYRRANARDRSLKQLLARDRGFRDLFDAEPSSPGTP